MSRATLFIALVLFCGAAVQGETVTACGCSGGCSDCSELPENSCVTVRNCMTRGWTQYWKVTDAAGSNSRATILICSGSGCTNCNTARQDCDNSCLDGIKIKCSSSGGASVGGIVGAVIGAICCYALIGLIVFCVMRRRRSGATFVSVGSAPVYGTPAPVYTPQYNTPAYGSGGIGAAVAEQNYGHHHHDHHHHDHHRH